MAEQALGAEPAAAERRFLTFRVDRRLYALPADEVAEVIRPPATARLPHSPRSLLGLANLRGVVAPVVSLRAMLGLDDGGAREGERAIVLHGEAPIVLAVDAVDALVFVGAGAVETRAKALAEHPGESLSGIFKAGAGEEPARVLDLRPMLAAIFERGARPARTARPRTELTPPRREAAGRPDDQQVLVTFEVADQDYALPLAAVQEIVPAPAHLAATPRAEAVLLGVSAYRNGLLPLLSLRGLLGFAPASASDGREKVLVTPVGGVLVGLVADRMRAIVRADADRIEPAPAMLAARAGGEARIKAIYRGADGGRLVSVLAPDQLFREDVMQRLGDPAASPAAKASTTEQGQDETIQVLVFRLGDEEFGLPVGAVDEVARVPDKITRVPRTPKFLEGVVNLRGEVLPVIDQRRRFDLPPFQGAEGRRLVVVRTARHRAGLIVDSVSEVLRAPAAAIAPAPHLAGEPSPLVNGVLNLEAQGRIVLMLEPAELLSRTERGLLDAFNATAKTDSKARP